MAHEGDAKADAEAKRLRFTPEHVAWLNHHIRNAASLLCAPTPERLVEARRRLVDICEAAVMAPIDPTPRMIPFLDVLADLLERHGGSFAGHGKQLRRIVEEVRNAAQ